jgi:hypothetical protein
MTTKWHSEILSPVIQNEIVEMLGNAPETDIVDDVTVTRILYY